MSGDKKLHISWHLKKWNKEINNGKIIKELYTVRMTQIKRFFQHKLERNVLQKKENENQ